MSARRTSSLLPLPLALLATTGCQPEQPYDHHWSSNHCVATFDAPVDWSGMNVPRPVQASAYLRRANGASSLVVELDGYGGGIADPYPTAPTVRFAVPPGAASPTDLHVVVDASDVRGPTVVEPGTAWLIQTDAADTSKPEDAWRFGSGTLRVERLSITENDTRDRDFVSLDAAFDLGGVTVAPLGADAGATTTPESVGGKLRLRCADEALGVSEAGPSPDDDAGNGDDGAGGSAGSGGDSTSDDGGVEGSTSGACGAADSCANPACGDCDGDPATFCEADLRTSAHCGSCGRSCGPSGTCDPAGACTREPVAADPATAVAIGAVGVGYLGPSIGLHFAPTGGAATVLDSAGRYSDQDAVAIDGSELYFASYAGLSRAALPSGPPIGVVGTIQPDAVRLIGVTPTHVYGLTLNEQNTHDVVRRFDRTSYAPEIVACLDIGTYDAAVSPSGAVFVSSGATLTRYDAVVGGNGCASTSAGALLVTAAAGEQIVRVVAGTSRLFYGVAGGSPQVLSIDAAGGGAPKALGASIPWSGAGHLPLAADGDVPFWVVGAAAPASGYLVVSAGADGAVVPFAATTQPVTSLAASAAGVAWGDAAGVWRVAR